MIRIVRALALVATIFAAASTARAEEVSIEHDGLTLLGTLTLAEGSTLADGVLLMTHGTLAHKDMEIMTNLRTLLAERGVNTLAISLSLGLDKRTGMYDCAVPHTHEHTDALAEIDAWIDWLRSKDGVGPVWLLGHSRGGNQTAWYAATADDVRFEKVVLVAPATYDAEAAASGYENRYGAPLPPLLAEMRSMSEKGKGEEPVDLPGFIYCPEAKATPNAFLSYYTPSPMRDTPTIVGNIPVPTLVIAGSGDTVVDDLPEKMDGKTDDTVGFEVVDLADHMFLGFFAEDLADMVADFVQR